MAKAVLPDYTMEERKKLFEGIEKGDTIVIISYGKHGEFWDIYYSEVKNKTQKGYIRLNNTKLLTWLEPGYYPLKDLKVKKFLEIIKLEKEIVNNIEKMKDEQLERIFSLMDTKDIKKLNEIISKCKNEYDNLISSRKVK